MSSFDPAAFTPPLRVPELAGAPVLLRPYRISDLAMVRQASADPLIPSISSVPPVYTDDAGRAFIERQHARATEGDGYSWVISHADDPGAGLGSIGLWLQEVESGRASIGYWLVAGA
ncbi:MAG TPA: GNAT family N-acetyltransferase, partial [Acidimicrobiales bacterium]|nr:GNAT family N-acetyltransferase [Acidimicrobiales bacterium]